MQVKDFRVKGRLPELRSMDTTKKEDVSSHLRFAPEFFQELAALASFANGRLPAGTELELRRWVGIRSSLNES